MTSLLGIRRGERIGTRLWQDALKADFDRDHEDRRSSMRPRSQPLSQGSASTSGNLPGALGLPALYSRFTGHTPPVILRALSSLAPAPALMPALVAS